MELFKAHRQWATRPADERFSSLEDLYTATRAYADTAVEADVDWSRLSTVAEGEDVKLVGSEGSAAVLTNWAFKQLAARVGAPSDYLSELPAQLASENLNFGLSLREKNPKHAASLLIHRNGSYLVRAITTDIYSRIWNHEVAEKLLEVQSRGWEPARADIRTRPDDRPALYASDHDMFAMLRSPNHPLDVNPSGMAPVWRGFIAENSEVGAGALKLTRFLYNEMCGNHIIWGASEVVELKVVHVGNVRGRMQAWDLALSKYADESASDEEAMIAEAKRTRIAETKEGLLKILFGDKSLGLSQKVLAAGYDAVVPEEDGEPQTVWGIVQGLTRHSQTIPYADKRNAVDRAAGRILQKVSF